MSNKLNRGTRRKALTIMPCVFFALLLLTGCLEQVQTTRSSTGSLHNFLLHLEAGELDDARAYFAPGLVTPSPELNQSIKAASDRVRRYEVVEKEITKEAEQAKLTVPLSNGEVQETIPGKVRLRPAPGQPTPGPDEGWQDADLVTARMVVRGPGWRILDFELKCCP